ncbi:hypothetical protein B0A48_16868 [Cryoendolithus antarcticus]|uniref:SGNH hydrolase-type esterase domain-containing protein n=1 Tax=Cryoendolithus antarcticus TaxID=1507870 RepID=A0A1V8SD08_9PEZI|nr:hypothetical protein B0A48_16868 [Cryoendolithus antarcticus]
MRSFLVFLSLALSVLSAPSPSPPFFRATSLNGKALAILPLGDSITLGWKDPSGNGYRKPLYDLLTTAHTHTTFLGSYVSGNFSQPHHEGHGGATSTVIAQAATEMHDSVDPNLVLLHAGVNDAALAAYAHEPEPIAGIGEVEKLIDLVTEFWPRAAVLVARIIPVDPAEFAEGLETQRNVDAINERISYVVAQRAYFGRRIALVDMSHGPITAADLVDFAHPSPEGYAKMADLWFTGIQDVVARGWVPEP